MNQKTILILTVLASLLLFANCNKDTESEIAKVNQFTYNDEVYDLAMGTIYYEGRHDDSGLYIWSIALASKAFDYNPSSGDVSGVGHIFHLEDIVSLDDNINGEYRTYTGDNWPKAETLGESAFSLKQTYPYSSSDHTDDDDFQEINNGTLKITKDGDIYTISFECKDANDINISLYYKGCLYNEDLF